MLFTQFFLKKSNIKQILPIIFHAWTSQMGNFVLDDVGV